MPSRTAPLQTCHALISLCCAMCSYVFLCTVYCDGGCNKHFSCRPPLSLSLSLSPYCCTDFTSTRVDTQLSKPHLPASYSQYRWCIARPALITKIPQMQLLSESFVLIRHVSLRNTLFLRHAARPLVSYASGACGHARLGAITNPY